VVQLRLTPAVCLMMQLAVMLSATESIQTHFRKEILKMCEEIAGHKLHVQKLQNEVEQRNAKINGTRAKRSSDLDDRIGW
jgi:septal ring factor EnvC (AmiA/AmiB activator)